MAPWTPGQIAFLQSLNPGDLFDLRFLDTGWQPVSFVSFNGFVLRAKHLQTKWGGEFTCTGSEGLSEFGFHAVESEQV